MPLNTHFDPTAGLDDTSLHVKGSSDVLEDTQVVSRHVALQQGSNIVEGATSLDARWMARLPLPASGLELGDALAVGTETLLSGMPPSFVTVTWAEIIEIVEITES
jgi:hypothetical protein